MSHQFQDVTSIRETVDLVNSNRPLSIDTLPLVGWHEPAKLPNPVLIQLLNLVIVWLLDNFRQQHTHLLASLLHCQLCRLIALIHG